MLGLALKNGKTIQQSQDWYNTQAKACSRHKDATVIQAAPTGGPIKCGDVNNGAIQVKTALRKLLSEEKRVQEDQKILSDEKNKYMVRAAPKSSGTTTTGTSQGTIQGGVQGDDTTTDDTTTDGDDDDTTTDDTTTDGDDDDDGSQ